LLLGNLVPAQQRLGHRIDLTVGTIGLGSVYFEADPNFIVYEDQVGSTPIHFAIV